MNKYVHKRLAILIPIVSLGMFLVGWELLIRAGSISPLILPRPAAVANVILQQRDYLLFNTLITVIEALLGLCLGAITGFALAILFLFAPIAENSLYPYAIALKAVPLIALAPIVVTWFGTGLASKVVLAAIISFFPVLVNSIEGFRSVEIEALELLESWSASPWKTFVKLRLPNALPSIFSGLKIASSFAIVGAVVAEFIGADKGIGFVIKSSSYFLSTDLTFAAIFFSALAGIAVFSMTALVERKVVFWKTSHAPIA